MSEVFQWLLYILGSGLYMAKRAFYQIKPPNPVATGPIDYLKRAGVPLLFRFAVESAIFWMLFSPAIVSKLLSLIGQADYEWLVRLIVQFPPAALVTGMAIDPMADWFIPTVIGKIPGLKEWWPQMPGPLPQVAEVKAEVVEQTTKVTQLQTTTTVVPEPKP